MGFTPSERPRLAVAVDGTLAAIHEPSRITIVELPGIAPFGEIGIDPEADASDVAWIGMPPRLLVVSRYAAHSVVYLLDPSGPRTIAELRLESPMTLFGTTGAHALVVGARGAAVLSASETHLTPYPFPARAVPSAAGAAGGQFVVALPSAIEEWDPAARMPKRRLKLPRPSSITSLGGTDRVVWLTTQHDPARIDVIPLVNRGQPRAHELPEPITHVTAHPRMDLLACVGGDSGRLYILDLDGRIGMRVVGPPGIARVEAAALVVGRVTGVLAAQAHHAVALVPLDGRDQPDASPAAPSPAMQPARAPDPEPEPEPPPARSTLFDDDEAPANTPTVVQLQSPPAHVVSTSDRRDRVREVAASPSAPASRERAPTWRDRAAGWYQAVATGAAVQGAPVAIAIEQLVARLELPPALGPALVLLYGAHLAGGGAAPVDVARVLDRDWAEALGRGHLAGRGLTIHRDSRVHLAPAILRALDELPPATGTLVGEPGPVSLLGPCAVVGAADASLAELAARFLGQVGSAILAGHDHAPPSEIVFEARAHGAVPMLRTPVDAPAIVVAASEDAADALGLPRID